jgi:hypothetical protein
VLRLNGEMFKADKIFEQVKHHLPIKSRSDAKVTFRRLIRKYLSYKNGGAIHPVTGRISKKIIIGKSWVHKGGRWRRKSKMLGALNIGRPSGLATELLVSSLAVQWSVLTQKRTTISHKRYQHLPTKWECYLCDVLVRLGIFDCRRHAEKHSKAKGK